MEQHEKIHWDKKLAHDLRNSGLNFNVEQIGHGIVAEERQQADRDGYLRGFENGYNFGFEKGSKKVK